MGCREPCRKECRLSVSNAVRFPRQSKHVDLRVPDATFCIWAPFPNRIDTRYPSGLRSLENPADNGLADAQSLTFGGGSQTFLTGGPLAPLGRWPWTPLRATTLYTV